MFNAKVQEPLADVRVMLGFFTLVLMTGCLQKAKLQSTNWRICPGMCLMPDSHEPCVLWLPYDRILHGGVECMRKQK